MRLVMTDYRLGVRHYNNGHPYILVEPLDHFPGVLRINLPNGTTDTDAEEINQYLQNNLGQIEYLSDSGF